MKALWLRVFLATTVVTVAVWQVYEWVWLPYSYDQETRRIEAEMSIRAAALSQQFAALGTDQWPQTVATYNQRSEDLLQLIPEGSPDWVDAYALVLAQGDQGLYVDGEDMLALVLLSDERTVLKNESFFIEISGSFDAAMWLFSLLALLLSGAALWWVLRPVETRLTRLAEAMERIESARHTQRLTVYGTGSLGRVEAAHNRASAALQSRMQDFHESISGQRDLMHAVAHEFRAPIARLRFAQDMLMECDEPQRQQDLADKVDEAINDLDELVAEVLGYSRIHDGGVRLRLEQLDLRKVIIAAVDKTRVVYPAISIHYDFDPKDPSDPFTVQADARLAERAIINVVRNAARYAQREVLIGVQPGTDRVQVSVEDDGPGIAPGKRERIFEPFTRLDSSRSRDSGGSGLGLAIVSAIMLRHGGEVTCGESSSGGARFDLDWPIGK